jgi:hypothetical protein
MQILGQLCTFTIILLNMTNSTNHILMIRPASFGSNPETAESNAFQSKAALEENETIRQKALFEFDRMVSILKDNHVSVHVIEDTALPVKPDAIFPNNWISFHAEGKIVTYPMLVPSRKIEVRKDIIEMAMKEWHYDQIIRLDQNFADNQILEGTGSLILDRPNRIAYACLSARTDETLLQEWSSIMGYRNISFRSVDQNGKPVYHTNVMMALGDGYAVVCLDSIPDQQDRDRLTQSLEKTGKEIIDISYNQMEAFAGNMLQVLDSKHNPLLVMSEQAFQSLTPDQINAINNYAQIVPIPLWTIEKYGGGSARCMMAEVFLP